MVNVNLDKAMAMGSNYRFEAMRELNPSIVTLRGEADARDIDNNPVALDEEAIALVVARMAQEAEEAKAIVEAKAAKVKALEELTVTTANGNVFDGDDTARSDMMAAIQASDILGITSSNWKLADNSWKLIELAELKEALALAIQAKGTILGS
jgi:hypothetical protein